MGNTAPKPVPVQNSAQQKALALDAADGVIDGKYFGTPIAARSGVDTHPHTMSAAQKAAHDLDAADGKIDGKYFGQQVVVNKDGASSFHAGLAPTARMPTYAPAVTYAAPAPAYRVVDVQYRDLGLTYPPRTISTGSSALALDAADGVIDGKYYGHGIATSRPVTTYAAPSSALALDAADGVIDGKYYGHGIATSRPVTTYAAPSPVMRSYAPTTYGSALALDAADGVIDGKYYGSNIAVRHSAPVISRTYGSSALALDAADGVIDGQYYGSPIARGSTYGGGKVISVEYH
mmetsp:Transcript_146187/g.255306  ORF Transcript_146187/g.255306 Transcript_146187/m.255306 type:complete len:291 (-) Transcript_146187:308-1180(-)